MANVDYLGGLNCRGEPVLKCSYWWIRGHVHRASCKIHEASEVLDSASVPTPGASHQTVSVRGGGTWDPVSQAFRKAILVTVRRALSQTRAM